MHDHDVAPRIGERHRSVIDIAKVEWGRSRASPHGQSVWRAIMIQARTSLVRMSIRRAENKSRCGRRCKNQMENAPTRGSPS